MADSSQNLFFLLGSILVIVIILALLGFINLSTNKSSQIFVTPTNDNINITYFINKYYL